MNEIANLSLASSGTDQSELLPLASSGTYRWLPLRCETHLERIICHLHARLDLCDQKENTGQHLLAVYSPKTIYCSDSVKIACYNLATQVWTMRNTLIEARQDSAVVMMGDKVILVGGFTKGFCLNSVTSLNWRTMSISEMPPLGAIRRKHSVAVLNDSIYVMGGFNGYQTLDSVERFHIAQQAWKFIAPLRCARRESAAAVFNNKVYISGGYDSDVTVLSSLECYDPYENVWTSLTPMTVARYLHCLVPYNGYLFAIGGFPQKNFEYIIVERYDPRIDIWFPISNSALLSGYTIHSSLGSDLLLYNNTNFYVISSEGSCDNFKIDLLTESSRDLNKLYCEGLFEISLEPWKN